MSVADKIRTRIAELELIRESYFEYQKWRIYERDHHGAWDVAVNLSETECEISGLKYALDLVQEAAGE